MLTLMVVCLIAHLDYNVMHKVILSDGTIVQPKFMPIHFSKNYNSNFCTENIPYICVFNLIEVHKCYSLFFGDIYLKDVKVILCEKISFEAIPDYIWHVLLGCNKYEAFDIIKPQSENIFKVDNPLYFYILQSI